MLLCTAMIWDQHMGMMHVELFCECVKLLVSVVRYRDFELAKSGSTLTGAVRGTVLGKLSSSSRC